MSASLQKSDDGSSAIVERMGTIIRNAHKAIEVLKEENKSLKAENFNLQAKLNDLQSQLQLQQQQPAQPVPAAIPASR